MTEAIILYNPEYNIQISKKGKKRKKNCAVKESSVHSNVILVVDFPGNVPKINPFFSSIILEEKAENCYFTI